MTIDFTRTREFGAIALAWDIGEYASSYDVEYSDDGTHWRKVRSVTAGNGGLDNLLLTESETRYLRLVLQNGPGSHYALAGSSCSISTPAPMPTSFCRKLQRTLR
ncbi:MAG: discoidin domain-containing protein [Xanthomonadales bacterium]|nr:discoidin domain-containing protein [Xanthomonadales bacterium]